VNTSNTATRTILYKMTSLSPHV